MPDSRLSALPPGVAITDADLWYSDQAATSVRQPSTALATYLQSKGFVIGTTPIIGGTDTRVLFDKAGIIGEDAGFTFNYTNKALTLASIANPSASTLTLTGGTALTTNQPVLNMTQGWAAGLAAPTAIRLNVTDGGATGIPLFLDLQKAGVSQLNIDSSGDVVQPFGGFLTQDGSNAAISFGYWRNGITLAGANPTTAGNISWVPGTASSATPDLRLWRDGAGILAQQNLGNPQTFRIYNTFTDASNYERGVLDWNQVPNAFALGTQNAGTGSARNFNIIIGGNTIINVNPNGVNIPSPFDFNVGNGRYIFWLGSTQLTNGSVNGNLVIQNAAANGFGLLQFGSTTSSFPALKRSAATLQFRLADDSAFAFYQWAGELRVSSQFDKTGDTTLATVTGLSVSLAAGRTYAFRVYLDVSPDAVGGHKYAIGTPDTLTASNIIYQVNSVNNTSNANIINSRQTALGGSVGVASGTSDYTEIVGTITVGVAGTLAVQFAQNVANGTSSVLVGSFMIVQDIP